MKRAFLMPFRNAYFRHCIIIHEHNQRQKLRVAVLQDIACREERKGKERFKTARFSKINIEPSSKVRLKFRTIRNFQ